MPYEDQKGVWKNKTDTFSDRGAHVVPRCLKNFCMPFSFKSTKILLEYCNSFILFCFEAVEGTVDNEPVNIVVVPEKFSTDRRGLKLWNSLVPRYSL